jgi:type II secretory pathway pseudopilin PulG
MSRNRNLIPPLLKRFTLWKIISTLRFTTTLSLPLRQKARNANAFSLVEVVLAVGLFAFVVVGLIGLISVGLRVNRESIDEMEAAHLAESLLAIRRVAPAVVTTDFPLPPFDAASSTPASRPLLVTPSGKIAHSIEDARFGLIYRIVPPGGTEPFARVYVCLYWPPQAGPDKAQGHYEMSSSFRLP